MENTSKVFLYGTLRPELAPSALNGIVSRLRSLGAASVRGLLYDLGNYPGAVIDRTADTLICGHVFEVPTRTLAYMDVYEGYRAGDARGSLFVRQECDARFADFR
jgi:gamma-glutamylcyclotransferase (GGCT)/AIG2-like uncharacterized protein YtfP